MCAVLRNDLYITLYTVLIHMEDLSLHTMSCHYGHGIMPVDVQRIGRIGGGGTSEVSLPACLFIYM